MSRINFLETIIERKRVRLNVSKQTKSAEVLRSEALYRRTKKTSGAFRRAITSDAINIIAEFKRASPSQGAINRNAQVIETARSYKAGGAAAISILTEEDFFLGSLEDLRSVAIWSEGEEVRLPLLRKDFIFDEYQIYEAAAAGADAVLLIVALLNDAQLSQLLNSIENEFQMDALVEVHSIDEMERALECGARTIGVNNRDLRTFEVSIDTSFELAQAAPKGVTLISESGLNSAAEIHALHDVGFKAFLLGESLMRSADPEGSLRNLIELSKSHAIR
ncbi:MAG: indole-3-glycerol phosphate synthase TrpC [Pyrinomonadaceae bacterium]